MRHLLFLEINIYNLIAYKIISRNCVSWVEVKPVAVKAADGLEIHFIFMPSVFLNRLARVDI